MNTSKKELRILDIFDDVPELISEKASFHTFIVNYDMNFMEAKYKEYLNDMMKFLAEKLHLINYVDYLNARSLNDYFNQSNLYGIIVAESQDSIYLDVLGDNELSDRIEDCISVFNLLSTERIVSESKNFKENPKSIKDNTEFFNFAPLL